MIRETRGERRGWAQGWACPRGVRPMSPFRTWTSSDRWAAVSRDSPFAKQAAGVGDGRNLPTNAVWPQLSMRTDESRATMALCRLLTSARAVRVTTSICSRYAGSKEWAHEQPREPNAWPPSGKAGAHRRRGVGVAAPHPASGVQLVSSQGERRCAVAGHAPDLARLLLELCRYACRCSRTPPKRLTVTLDLTPRRIRDTRSPPRPPAGGVRSRGNLDRSEGRSDAPQELCPTIAVTSPGRACRTMPDGRPSNRTNSSGLDRIA
jgi:hypothetical protein